MDLSKLNTGDRVSAVSQAVVIVAAFLPWVSIFGISAIGVEGDGVLTLILALGGLACVAVSSGLVGTPKAVKPLRITNLVLALLTALIGLFDMNGAAAIGLYLTLFAGLAWVAGAPVPADPTARVASARSTLADTSRAFPHAGR